MAKKIEVVGQALVITDTVSSNILFEAPKGEYYYDIKALFNQGKIKFYNLDHEDNATVRPPIIALSDAVNSADAAFDIASFQTFSRENLGFKTASGGSGAVDAGTGWQYITDSAFTSVSPLVIAQGATSNIVLNGATNITAHLPAGVSSFYNTKTGVITPENVGDGMTFTLGFKAKNDNINGVATFAINIGGSIGLIFPKVFLFPKGANQENDY